MNKEKTKFFTKGYHPPTEFKKGHIPYHQGLKLGKRIRIVGTESYFAVEEENEYGNWIIRMKGKFQDCRDVYNVIRKKRKCKLLLVQTKIIE